ncbi:hypothetical protein G6F24_016623 [Rhizopus arrhizus]|nr:hypothetical protein G6F24_016623 [Rhizopus arrhizus]
MRPCQPNAESHACPRDDIGRQACHGCQHRRLRRHDGQADQRSQDHDGAQAYQAIGSSPRARRTRHRGKCPARRHRGRHVARGQR